MADSKITALTALTAADPVNDMFPVVDVSDTSMAASGTTKRISANNILSSSPTASGALTVTGLVTAGSTTITGAATVGTTLGVTGVSTFAAGTALLPALTTTGDTNTGIYYPAADTFAVTTAGVERYRVDSSGNVGIGVTQSAWESSFKAIQINNRGAYISATSNSFSTSPFVPSGNNGYYDATNSRWEYVTANAAAQYVQSTNSHLWYTAAAGSADAEITDFATAKMTLDASGNLLVGTTTQLQSANSRINVAGDFYNFNGVSLKTTDGGSGSAFIAFINESGAVIGSVNRNGATNAVNYNTSSDYRLKESIAPLNNGLARVNALKPSIYKWKSNGSDGEGFLAHELAEAVPFAVSGEKDAMNADGTIKSQGIDMSRIVPILVAAIQELTAEVNALKNA